MATQSLEWWPAMAKETPLHEVILTLLDTNPVFQCLGLESQIQYFGVSALESPQLYSVTLMLVAGKFKNFVLSS